MVNKALEQAAVADCKKLAGVAVALGPGQHDSLRVGIDLAQAIGAKFDIPVIPVNHLEAHIMTARMELAQQLNANQKQFSANFPFLSVIVTGKHTEIVLTRGVGLHTILGFTVDMACGMMLDRSARLVADACKHLFGLDFESSTD